MRANRLKVIETILESTTKFIANKKSFKNSWKKKKIKEVALLLNGALNAESKVGLKMNVEKKNLQKVISLLPALKNPTISELADRNWFAIETIIGEEIVRNIIPKLKQSGAEGIIEYPLNKVIY